MHLHAFGAILAPHPRHDAMRPRRVLRMRDLAITLAAQHFDVFEVVHCEIARPTVDAHEAMRGEKAGTTLALGKMLRVVPVLEFLFDVRGRLHRGEEQPCLLGHCCDTTMLKSSGYFGLNSLYTGSILAWN